jgi:hypothetical protein
MICSGHIFVCVGCLHNVHISHALLSAAKLQLTHFKKKCFGHIFFLLGVSSMRTLVMPFLSAAKLQSLLQSSDGSIKQTKWSLNVCVRYMYAHSQPASIIWHLRACHLGDVMSFTLSSSASTASNQPIEHHEFFANSLESSKWLPLSICCEYDHF